MASQRSCRFPQVEDGLHGRIDMNMTRVELCAAFSGGVRRPPEQPVHCDHEHRHGGDAERHPGKSPLGSFSAMYARP